ncbi:MAG: tRNA (adenosine(37)-N6)-dimethylallyltransferase MiaA [Bacteroidales bacterium]|nr:tRNA (adenosine(37)-N6)-dimethylallyltransferase MiaA [Bacteroidales bacterium]
MDKDYNLITVLGPTATGKTKFGVLLAHKLNGEIISADSRQIYRKMDIGTGKDINDYYVQKKIIPYHLIDIKEPGYKYNVYEFQKDFLLVFNDIISRNKLPVLCGGSGLYIESVIKGYKLTEVPINQKLRDELEKINYDDLVKILKSYKKLHNKTDIDTKKRLIRAIEISQYYKTNPEKHIDYPEIKTFVFGIKFDRNTVKKRITQRLEYRLKNGMIEEVKVLLDLGIKPEQLIYYGLEYKYLTYYITGKIKYEEMCTKLNIEIHRFSKRQMTWFRRMERNGIKIHWLDGYLPIEKKIERALSLLEL